MQSEYHDVLTKNRIWELVEPQLGSKHIRCKWVYKNTNKLFSSLDKHKASLNAKGYTQKEVI